jgi:hypothetical protein
MIPLKEDGGSERIRNKKKKKRNAAS